MRPSTQEGALRALKSFAVLMPEARQAALYQDLTQTTPADIDAWIAAAFQQGLAPSDHRDLPPRDAGLLCLPA